MRDPTQDWNSAHQPYHPKCSLTRNAIKITDGLESILREWVACNTRIALPLSKAGVRLISLTAYQLSHSSVTTNSSRSTSKGQPVESSESAEAYVIPHANSEGLQTLSPRPPYADPVNFEDRTGSLPPVLLDRCTASEASRMVPRLQNAEFQAEDAPVVLPQTQQYRDYASSFPLSDDVFQQYCTWPTTALEPEASWADAIFGPGLGDCHAGGYRKVQFA
jgi:hypothetical protein